MISISNLKLRFGDFSLTGISFDVPTGEYAVLMGKTGSGKTSILEAICGLRPIVSGQIRLADRDVTQMKPAARGIGYVPQDGALFDTMTVQQHLAFALEVRRVASESIRQRVTEIAGLLELDGLLKRYPKHLSGGERQRVALGRDLAFRPSVLLMDEPLSALDEETKEHMFSVLKRVRDELQVTALHVTHSREESRVLADRLLRIEQGKVTTSLLSAAERIEQSSSQEPSSED